MPTRYVRMPILTEGGDKARATLDDLAKKVKELNADDPRITPEVHDDAAQAKLKDLRVKVAILNRMSADIGTDVDDEKTKAKLLDIRAMLRDLTSTVAKPEIDLKGADKTEARLIRIKLMLDEINKTDAKASADGGGIGGFLRRTFSGNGQPGGRLSIFNQAGGLKTGFQNPYIVGAAALGGGTLLTSLPALLGLGIGTGVGGLATGTAFTLASKGNTAITADQAAVKSAQQSVASARLSLKQATTASSRASARLSLRQAMSGLGPARQQLSQDKSLYGPFQPLTGLFSGLPTELAGSLSGIVGHAASTQRLPGGAGGLIKTPATGLVAIFSQLAGFVKTLGPELSSMFKASLPFVHAWVMLMEYAAKTILPVFTYAMNQMVKSGALKTMMTGLIPIIRAFVQFIRVLGPDMAISAKIFAGAMKVVAGIITGIGIAVRAIIDIWRIAGGLIVTIVKVIAGVITGNFGAAGRAIGAFGHNVRDVWDHFRHDAASALSGVGIGLDKFGHSVANQFDLLKKLISTIWDAAWHYVIHDTMAATDTVVATEKRWWHDTVALFDRLRHDLASSWDATWHDIRSALTNSVRADLGYLKTWWHDITSGFTTLRRSITSVWNSLWNDVKNLTRTAIRALGTVVREIEPAFRTPVAWVVNNVWDRLAGIWNKITGIVHLGGLKLPVVQFAQGGRVTQGTGPTSDDVLARVSKGETIVSAKDSARLAPIFSAAGVPGYAAGGIPNPLPAIGNFFSSVGHNIMGWLTKPLSFIMSHVFGPVTGMLGSIPGAATGETDILKGLTTSLIKSLAGKFHNFGFSSSHVNYKAGAGVAQWAGLVRRALSMEGLAPFLLGRVLYQMQTESGGNPNAINLTDSNAAAGDPSRGLMQTIMSTFRAYHWPGTSFNIYDPLANIAAALNYARHVYGPSLMSGGMGIGSGHGYANGGWITEPIIGRGLRTGGTYTFGEGGVPEYVSPHPMMGGGARHYHINIQPTPLAHPADIGREVVKVIKQFEKRSGASWRTARDTQTGAVVKGVA